MSVDLPVFNHCRLLYSTQSGRAKACSRRCARIIREETPATPANGSGQTFDSGIPEIHGFVDQLRSKKTLLVLFVSTTGDGEHTDTIQRTWKQLLQRSLPATLFKGVFFSIFNLGDRAYGPQFCAAGRKLAVRLIQLGAQLVGDPGYGDDGTPNGGVLADLDIWIRETLLVNLAGKEDIPEQKRLPTEGVPVSPLRVRVVSSEIHRDSPHERTHWQKFGDFYDEFFTNLCPLTAYSYDENLQRAEAFASAQPPLVGRVVQNERITAEGWEQNTRHIRLDIGGGTYKQSDRWSLDGLPYRAGDVASTLPVQSPDFVERFIHMLPKELRDIADMELQVDKDEDVVQLSGVDCCLFWPRRCTLRGWLSHCADIHALPEREDLRALSHYCSMDHPQGDSQREKLMALSETEGAALYADYILREKRTWPDVMYDFDSLRSSGSTLTLEALFGLLSPVRPRDFSIASSPSQEWQRVRDGIPGIKGFALELCVAVVAGTTPLGRSYGGLCSSYLSFLDPSNNDSVVRLWIRPGSFQGLPLGWVEGGSDGDNIQHPIICIGAGTGVAPLRGLILEREAIRRSYLGLHDLSIESQSLDLKDLECENVLIFGCRRRLADFYYETQWQELSRGGRLGLLTAFSRDQVRKVYVQQVLQNVENLDLWLREHLLGGAGGVYIAGSPKMARAVKEVFVNALKDELGDEKHVLQLFTKLQRQGRWSIEAWS